MGAKELTGSYDAFLKNLIGKFYPPLFRSLLGVEVKKMTLLKHEYTEMIVKSHRMDYLARVQVIKDGEESEEIYHIEFQGSNDQSMHLRMVKYALSIVETFDTFPTQILVYFGERPLNMIDKIGHQTNEGHLFYKYKIVDFNTLNPSLFLKEDNWRSIFSPSGASPSPRKKS